MGCGCIYGGDEDGEVVETRRTVQVAVGAAGVCCECGEAIQSGDRYEIYGLADYQYLDEATEDEGAHWGAAQCFGVRVRWRTERVFKTCEACLRVVDAFFCDGHVLTQCYSRIRDHVQGLGGDLDLCCINGLSPAAADKLERLVLHNLPDGDIAAALRAGEAF